jgi:hypothetical protein
MKTKKKTHKIKKRLEYLRVELRGECISYGELSELQSLVKYIDPSDKELLEAAGVPEKKMKSPKKMYLVIQEGGTSLEHYANLYDTKAEAKAAMKGHAKASYNSFGPIEVPENLREAILLDDDAKRGNSGDPLNLGADLLNLIEAVLTEVHSN